MSIFKRLYDIAKANVEYRIKVKPENLRHTWRQRREHSHEQTWEDPQTHQRSYREPPRQSAEDQKLAQHYASLEIPYGSDLVEVKKAWKKLVRQYHPDLHSSDPEKEAVARELTQGLNEAYEAIEKHLKGQ